MQIVPATTHTTDAKIKLNQFYWNRRNVSFDDERIVGFTLSCDISA